MRLGPDGVPLDHTSRPLTAGGAPFAVASDTTSYLVAHGFGRIGFIRVEEDGTAVATEDTFKGQEPDSLVWTGKYFVLSYLDFSDRKLALIDAHGTVMASGMRAFRDPRPRSDRLTLVAGNQDQILVTWTDSGDQRVHASLLRTESLLTGAFGGIRPEPAATPGAASEAQTAAWAGASYIVAWIEATHDDPQVIRNELRVRILDDAGRPLAEPRTIASGVLDRHKVRESAVAVTWTGSEFLVAYILGIDGSSVLEVARISSAGELLNTRRRISDADNHRLGGLTDRFLVTTERTYPWSWGVVTVTRLAESASGETLIISRSLPEQSLNVATSCGATEAFVWVERAEQDYLYYGELQSSTDAVGNTRVLIGKHSSTSGASAVCIGDTVLIAYSAVGKIHIMTYSRSTREFRENAVLPGIAPLLGWNGREFLLAWHSLNAEINLLRLRPDASLIDSVPFVLRQSVLERYYRLGDFPTALVWTETDWLLVFLHARLFDPPAWFEVPPVETTEVQAIFLSESMRRLGDVISIGPPATKEGTNAGIASAVWNGNAGLVAWPQQMRWYADAAHMLVRLDRTGVASEPTVIGASQWGDRLSIRAEASRFRLAYSNRVATLDESGSLDNQQAFEEGVKIERILTIGGREAIVFSRMDPREQVSRLWISLSDIRRRSVRR